MNKKIISAIFIVSGLVLLFKRKAITGGGNLTENLLANYELVPVALLLIGIGAVMLTKGKGKKKERKFGIFSLLVILSLFSLIISLFVVLSAGML